ncbi:type II toxin-antitoxin system YoeB family toxin [Algoriphagus ratkowskyi]|uniref:Putative mRNA interferase YoeB n=1 Tax=Algoriphagus ratkowskyi TaxID=57028 RepID=A0ABY3HSG4_9BACT|nr:type II toxin-antitoxin system YoeB family toxin [Algoriphagus ratkowskyi]
MLENKGIRPLGKPDFNSFISHFIQHSETGTGKPDRLKNNYSGFWSRRINLEHRLVYSVD